MSLNIRLLSETKEVVVIAEIFCHWWSVMSNIFSFVFLSVALCLRIMLMITALFLLDVVTEWFGDFDYVSATTVLQF